MTGNVKSLYGGPTGERAVNANAVAVLEEMLTAARSGEIVGVAVINLYHDGLAGYRIGGMIGSYGMIGALEMAKASIIGDFT